MLHYCEGHGIEEHGTNIEEVAVKKAHAEESEDRDCNVCIGVGTLTKVESNGVNSVDTVCDNAYSTAGCEHLDNGVMPTGWEECAE